VSLGDLGVLILLFLGEVALFSFCLPIKSSL
jgi:hypothetical protein